jgi:hypothetical protein
MPRKRARVEAAEAVAVQQFYLMKSEPDVFSIQHLAAREARTVGEHEYAKQVCVHRFVQCRSLLNPLLCSDLTDMNT